jgi:hypothetical protein
MVLSETELRRILGRCAATRQADLLIQAATLQKDLPVASEAATSAHSSALARLVFASIAIKDDRVAAVVPQPNFAPFFQKPEVDEGLLEANSNGATELTPSVKLCTGGSDGVLSASSSCLDRCSRIPFPDLRTLTGCSMAAA